MFRVFEGKNICEHLNIDLEILVEILLWNLQDFYIYDIKAICLDDQNVQNEIIWGGGKQPHFVMWHRTDV